MQPLWVQDLAPGHGVCIEMASIWPNQHHISQSHVDNSSHTQHTPAQHHQVTHKSAHVKTLSLQNDDLISTHHTIPFQELKEYTASLHQHDAQPRAPPDSPPPDWRAQTHCPFCLLHHYSVLPPLSLTPEIAVQVIVTLVFALFIYFSLSPVPQQIQKRRFERPLNRAPPGHFYSIKA